MTPADAQHVLDTAFAAWVRALQPKITALDTEVAVLEIPITEDIARVGGIVSGQALATLADTAMVFACIGHLQKLELVSTVTLDTQFRRPGSGDSSVAKASVTRAGKAMIFAQCTLSATPSGKPVAFATATFARPAA